MKVTGVIVVPFRLDEKRAVQSLDQPIKLHESTHLDDDCSELFRYLLGD